MKALVILSWIQWLFIISTIIFFLGMNLGVLKYNTPMTWVSIAIISMLTLGIWKYKQDWLQMEISPRNYKQTMWGVFLVFVLAQAYVVYCIPLEFVTDFLITKNQVMHMVQDFSILPMYNDYYHAFPFNLDAVGIIALAYKLLGNYTHVVMLFATLVNISAILVGLSVKNLTGNRVVSISIAALYNLFSLFCIKTYYPYTGNLGLFWMTILLYVYTQQTSRSRKVILLILTAAIAERIKITCLIPFIGIAIVEGFVVLRRKDYRLVSIAAITSIVCFGATRLAHNAYFHALDFKHDPTIEHNTIYYFALGQNNEYGGQHYHPISVEGDIHRPKEVRDSIFLNMGLNYMKGRSAVGHVKFFISKIAYCWGDTNLDYHNGLKDKSIPLAMRHSIWYLALLCMSIGVFMIKDRRYMALMLSICGAVAYLYISEASASYVIMYSSIVFVMAGWMLSTNQKPS